MLVIMLFCDDKGLTMPHGSNYSTLWMVSIIFSYKIVHDVGDFIHS